MYKQKLKQPRKSRYDSAFAVSKQTNEIFREELFPCGVSAEKCLMALYWLIINEYPQIIKQLQEFDYDSMELGK